MGAAPRRLFSQPLHHRIGNVEGRPSYGKTYHEQGVVFSRKTCPGETATSPRKLVPLARHIQYACHSCCARRFFKARIAARFLFVSDSRTSTYSDGSSTICPKITAGAAASGHRAHQRYSVPDARAGSTSPAPMPC